MKMKEGAPENVAYRMDAGDGRTVISYMPREVAEEAVRRAESYLRDGGELVVDGRMRFCEDLFEEEPGDEARFPKPESKPRRKAATKG